MVGELSLDHQLVTLDQIEKKEEEKDYKRGMEMI